jgi:xanthine dehydrogenase YagT iron-sulfur-binding subunit
MVPSHFENEIEIAVNGKRHKLLVGNEQSLLDVLREKIKLTGAKKGCDQGACGSCTVLLDGVGVCSCLTLAVEAEGHSITTIEGLGEKDLDPIQRAFIQEDAFQCGFCTSGQILTARALLDKVPNPNLDEITEAFSGNLCRCGAYDRIAAAVLTVARESHSHHTKSKNRS